MEAKPYINKHHKTSIVELAKLGTEMYHSVNPHIQEYKQKLGQMSLTDEIIREAPDADEAV